VRLLRTFIPSPAKRTWSKQFRDGLQFRGWGTRVAVPILAMVLLGVVIVVLADANSGNPAPAPDTSSLGFPPATLAGSQFTAAPNDRGITQTLGRVTSSGAEIVAVGAQTGARLARAQFFVSMDEGRSWTMGTEQATGGGPPLPGHAARFVAGGQGEWVAVGPDSIWTSGNGESWTLISQSGLPLQPGDQISVLKRTAGGFIAAGANVPNGDQAKSSPVIFMSVNGIDWERLGAAQLGLTVQSGGRVLNIRYAAVAGNLILVAGDVATTTTTGKKHRPVTVRTSAAWLSTDGGATWTPAAVPTGHGAQDLIVGEAPVGAGLVVLRPATIGGTPGQNPGSPGSPGSPGRQPGKNPTQAVDVYRSPNGTTWTFEATLTTPSGFEASMTNGGPNGATVTGTAGHDLVAFVSATGASWQQTQTFGTTGTPDTPDTTGTPGTPGTAEAATPEDIEGITITGSTTVVTGSSPAGPDSSQPVITVLNPHGQPQDVDIAKIPGALDPQLAVNAVAAQGSVQVAVGGANGYPAAWTSTDGGSAWSRAPGLQNQPGLQQLTSVAHGAMGWLAIGGATAGAPHPIVVVSPTGGSWAAVGTEGAFAGPGLVTEQAAAGPQIYVIVGHQDTQAPDGTVTSIPAAWWSVGLTGWQRAALDTTSGATTTQMTAVTAAATGFVAVGESGDQPSAWTSPDGRNWTQADLPLPIGATRAVLQHVASYGRTAVAAGTAIMQDGSQLPFAASSADNGATWTESALPVPQGAAAVTAIAADADGFAVVGTYGDTQAHQDVVVWTSRDGTTWKTTTPAGPGMTGRGIQAITGLTPAGGTLTGVGFTASPASEEPVFWQSPIR
jgi:hypothetical protein